MISRDRFEMRTVSRVEADGDGDYTVFMVGGAWLTWHPGDTDRVPAKGDQVLCRLPLIVEIGERDEMEAAKRDGLIR